jgi:2,3-bisphosphoglycerate-independent phosphoglycerate mutase
MTNKTIILLVDGSADHPIERMGGLTPLAVARKPNIDRLAAEGRCGTLATVPAGMTADSAVANLSVLGYDPRQTYQGRGVLEAASLGVDLGDDDVALRVNVIHTAEGRIVDHSAGHIHDEEALPLIEMLQAELGVDGVEFHRGISYRHLLVLRGAAFSPELECYPPHDHVGRPVADSMIRATAPAAEATASRLNALIEASVPLLANHPVNVARRAAGKRDATTIWPWAPGRRPTMRTLQQRFGIDGAVISAVDLIHGLGRYAGMTSIEVEGVTGLFDTNYEGKARAAREALRDHDLVYVHVEGPDEAGHSRDLGLKIHCIEAIDSRLLGPLLADLADDGVDPVVGVLPDHLTPVERGDHVGEPVPVLIRDPSQPADGVQRFDEVSVGEGSLGALEGVQFMEALLGRSAR